MNPKDKIVDREELDRLCNVFYKNKTIVTTNGSFDILHRGHVESLQAAKKYGDILVVGLNSDSSVKAYKSPARPINPQEDRAYMLASLECVDYVTIFDELDPRELLAVVKPRYHVKSKEGFKGLEREVVESNGGEIILLDDIGDYSTTKLISILAEGLNE